MSSAMSSACPLPVLCHGPWQKTGTVGEGGPAYPDDTAEECFNRDGGLEVPGCWTAVMRRQGGRSNPHQPLTSSDVYPQ